MSGALAAPPVVSLNQEDPRADTYRTFEVRGLADALLAQLREAPPAPEQWPQLLSVFVLDGAADPAAESLPIWGHYRVEPGLLRFLPGYPLVDGQCYRVRWSSGTQHEVFFELPHTPHAPPQVVRVYPSADVLPEDLLRFYVYFSQPMREGQACSHARLYELDGATESPEAGAQRGTDRMGTAAPHERRIEDVFLDPLEELWDPTQTRLTLLFDPGRVKTGLAAHRDLGRALHPGRRYRLEIAGGWRDAYGGSLRTSFSKTFTVTRAQTTTLTIDRFRIQAPSVQTRAPLTISFPTPMDHVLLGAFMTLRDPSGRSLSGEVVLEDDETLWHFTPERLWERGRYTLEVDTRLEDVAGNNLQGLFDRPAGAQRTSDARVTLSFEI